MSYIIFIDRLGAVTARRFYIRLWWFSYRRIIRQETASLLQALGTLVIIGGIYLVRDEGRAIPSLDPLQKICK